MPPAAFVPRVPAHVRACLFDLDGVLTSTARLHAKAWKSMFDDFLEARAAATGQPLGAFELPDDYNAHVDGKPRLAGVRSFLESRGITLPEGDDDDPPGAPTVHGLGRRKNDLVLELIEHEGVEPFPGSVKFVEAVRDAGLRRAVVSSSKNCQAVLEAAGISDLFEVRVDGLDLERELLRGKPAPDTFLAAAQRLGVEAGHAAVFEDALAGVEAGRAGGFGWVVGVDRGGQAEELRKHGADVVVQDLAELVEAR